LSSYGSRFFLSSEVFANIKFWKKDNGVGVMKLASGLIQVYTGNGKGKTTAALGLALRAVGREMTVCMIQFIKGGGPCGEHLAAMQLAPYFSIIRTGREGRVGRGNSSDEDSRLAREALMLAGEALAGGKYNIVILDEINVAISFGMISVDDVLAIMDSKPPDVELVLTGRNAHERIIASADLVTEMREVKHYFKVGVPARLGIEK
jgi:cob(I)alamin adenosyltransferase